MMDRQTNLPLDTHLKSGYRTRWRTGYGLGQAYKRTNGWTDKRTENLSARMHLKRIREKERERERERDRELLRSVIT